MTMRRIRSLSNSERQLWMGAVADTVVLRRAHREATESAPPRLRLVPRDETALPPTDRGLPFADTLDRATENRLRRGKREPDARLDLHGLTLAQAQAALQAAVHKARARGQRCLLVITGKGRPDRPSRLRDQLGCWVREPALAAAVHALRPAHPRHGGAGASYLMLRRNDPYSRVQRITE